MKFYDRLNFLLLGTLWTLAIVLILYFWLNTAYSFDMFSNAHWQLVSTLQAEHQHIASGFYIAFIAAIIMDIIGLYLLFRPRFRKINFNTQSAQRPLPPHIDKIEPVSEQTPAPKTTTETEPEKTPDSESVKASDPLMVRPPRLHIQMPTAKTRPVTATQNTQPIAKRSTPAARYTDEIRAIFEKYKFRVLTPKPVANVSLSLIALGANETLWIGANDISHEKMADVMLAFKTVFTETLEDIEIDINAFIINPTDNDHVEAILDFNSIQELNDAIQNIPNEPESGDEEGNMDAFAGYIETVLTYLGNK